MSQTAIKVQDLSKRYRIGVRETEADSLVEKAVSLVTSPVRNLRRLRNLTRFADNGAGDDVIWALREVSFRVEPGEVVGVIGANGAGKSTLLKILSRITYPTGGRVEISGRVSSLLEVGTGFHPELTGKDNVYLNGTILGMTKKEIDRKLDEIVEFSGVAKFIDTPVKRYSSGMRVRLAFSVAAHLEPEILLVDEVLAVGDVEFQRKSIGKMGEVAQSGRTILFVSHNMAAVRNLCPRTLLLKGSTIAYDGETNEAVEQYLASGNVEGVAGRWVSDTKGGEEDRTFHLEEVVVHNGDTAPRGRFLDTEEICISIQYRLTTHLRGLRVSLRILGGRGEIVVTTHDFDAVNQAGREKGEYVSICRLPSRLLNRGKYYISIWARDVPGPYLLPRDRNYLCFEIERTGYVGKEILNGVLSPVVPKWTVQK